MCAYSHSNAERPAIPRGAGPPKMKTPNRERSGVVYWWPGAESNHRHADFQSAALPTELPGQEGEV